MEQVKSPPARPASPEGSKRPKEGRNAPKSVKSGKSELWYARKGENHTLTGSYRVLNFFSRIGTCVLITVTKNLYISTKNSGPGPRAPESNCNKLVTLEIGPPERGPQETADRPRLTKKERSRPRRGPLPTARQSKRTGQETNASRSVQFSYARRHDSDGNPHGDQLADFAGPPAEDCHGAGPTLFPALRPPPASAQPAPVAGLPAS